MKINLTDIFNLKNSVIYNPDNFKAVSKVSIDSRTIKANSIYVALKGNKFDGHNFVKEAVSKGAIAIIINKNRLTSFDNLNCTIITVPNTTIAYGELAQKFRNKFNGKLISITGSNGKTTTKEILATILSEKFKTNKTLANNNNHIGVPKTIFSIKKGTEVLVLEHGTNHFGEIDYTANIAKPNYAVITNIGDSHLEYLIDTNGVYKEKSSLFNETLSNGGTIFVNTDDAKIKSETKKTKNRITFGFNGRPDIKGEIIGFSKDGKTKLSVEYLGKKIISELPLYGISNSKNMLAAIAVALYLGVSKTQIQKAIKKLNQVKGRLFVETFQIATLIDDTYNANPASMVAAIDLLKKIKTYQLKTLIIGDMFELGENALEIHRELATIIIKSKIQNVFMIGKLMKTLSSEMQNTNINWAHFRTRKHLASFINKTEFKNQVVLVKGSRGMKMEEFVTQIREKLK